MTGLKLQISGVENDRSINRATITAQTLFLFLTKRARPGWHLKRDGYLGIYILPTSIEIVKFRELKILKFKWLVQRLFVDKGKGKIGPISKDSHGSSGISSCSNNCTNEL